MTTTTTGPMVADRSGRRWFFAASLPVLACLFCPVCLTAGAGVLSALGLGAAVSEGLHHGIVAVSVAIAIGAAAWLRRRHRRTGPLLLTLAGAVALAAGCLSEWPVPEYAGTALILLAALWNWRLGRQPATRPITIRRPPASATLHKPSPALEGERS